MQNNELGDFISETIKSNDVVLFMKGSSNFPQCGFSAAVVAILQKFNVEFLDVNVLESDQLRSGIKVFSDWPTIPQLYVKGEFIGGCDIIKELHENGELEQLFQKSNILVKK